MLNIAFYCNLLAFRSKAIGTGGRGFESPRPGLAVPQNLLLELGHFSM